MGDRPDDQSISSVHRWPAQGGRGDTDAVDITAIDGEAYPTLEPTVAEPPSLNNQTATPELDPSMYQQDPVLVLTALNPVLKVNPGASVTLRAQILNNGERVAHFELRVEGWIDPAWLSDNPIRHELAPGQKAIIQTEICPPREASIQAGERHLVLTLRSNDYPGRESRQGLSLAILPFDEIVVGEISPRTVYCSWRERTVDFRTILINQGNRPVQVRLHGEGDRFRYHLSQGDGKLPWSLERLAGSPQMQGELLVDLEPGARQTIHGAVQMDRLPLLRRRQMTFRLSASHVGKQLVPRTASARLVAYPLLSSRLLAMMALLLIFSSLIVAALGATGFGLVQLVDGLSQNGPVTEETIVSDPATAYAIILPVDEVVPAAETNPPIVIVPDTVGDDAQTAATGNSVNSEIDIDEGREAAVPLVNADQISAPGDALPAAPQPAAPAPPTRAELTYAQMFQEIGQRYNLDWRMLAAQAYVESKFDTLALGKDGDLGLMQVLPRTWQEWAPAVEVNDPFDAYSNTLVAAVYLDYLRTNLSANGHSETRWMLVAYNWGPDKVNRFLADGNGWDNLPASLQQYANEILRIAESLPQ